MLKKSIFVSVLACGSAPLMAQAPVDPGMLSGGGGESSMQPPVVRSRTASTVDLRPLADASTPYACACAEFEIDEFLAASAKAVATPTSLPGLGEQTAEFLQNQGGGSGGGAPSALSEGESGGDSGGAPDPAGLAAAPSALSGEAPDGGDGSGAPDPAAGGGLAAAPSAPGGENSDGGDAGGAPGGGGEAQSFSVSLPADLEENSPFPQPFQLASIVNVDVAVSGRNPSAPSDDEEDEEDNAESESEEFEDEASEGGSDAEEEFEEV